VPSFGCYIGTPRLFTTFSYTHTYIHTFAYSCSLHTRTPHTHTTHFTHILFALPLFCCYIYTHTLYGWDIYLYTLLYAHFTLYVYAHVTHTLRRTALCPRTHFVHLGLPFTRVVGFTYAPHTHTFTAARGYLPATRTHFTTFAFATCRFLRFGIHTRIYGCTRYIYVAHTPRTVYHTRIVPLVAAHCYVHTFLFYTYGHTRCHVYAFVGLPSPPLKKFWLHTPLVGCTHILHTHLVTFYTFVIYICLHTHTHIHIHTVCYICHTFCCPHIAFLPPTFLPFTVGYSCIHTHSYICYCALCQPY